MAASRFSDSFEFLPQGAIVKEFIVAGKNIILGFPTAESYKSEHSPFVGETIGRVANRIKNARIDELNGRSYALTANNGPNMLHGGEKGFGKRLFDGPSPVQRHGRDAVMFKYLSKDGEEGFPGDLELTVWYFPAVEMHDGVEKTSLEIEYEAELVGDEVNETVVAVTNHSYFNLNGPTLEGTKAVLYTNMHQVTDDNDIPTGEIGPYPGIEPNEEFTLGAEEPDPDHCFVMDAAASNIPLDTRELPTRRLCQFYHPHTQIHLETLSTEPAFQFYTGRFIDIPEMDGMPARGPRSGMCIEASRYVNAINDERWKHMVVLKKGQTFGSRTIYRAWKAAA